MGLLRTWLTFGILGLAFAGSNRIGAQDAATVSAGIQIDRGDDSGVFTVHVPTANGRVAWSDIARAIAIAGRLDDRPLASKLPRGDFKVTGFRAGLLTTTINQVLGPEIHLDVVQKAEDIDPVVEVTIDRDRLRTKMQSIRSELRRQFANGQSPGLELELNSDQPDKPLIVLIHGYNSTPASLRPLHTRLSNAGFVCGRFSYPNDGPLTESASLLSRDLCELRRKYPHRRLILVTHSMGGLVARAVIENPDLDPGNVRRLIMIAPPNGGSHWAFIPLGFDAWDQIAVGRDKPIDDLVVNSLTDGWNEARRDLRRVLDFSALNTRGRNPGVEYTLLLGTGAVGRIEDVSELRKLAITLRSEHRLGHLIGPRLDEYFSDLDELTAGAGDGVVAVQRGRLAGVEDTVLLPFRHNAVLRDFDDPVNKQVLETILNRLARETK